jgi:hypothetical protein
MDVVAEAWRALEWLQGFAPRVRRVATVLRVIAAVGIGATALIVLLLVADVWVPSLAALVAIVVVGGVLGFAPVMLWIFAGGVAAIADLPDAVAGSPALFGRYTDELSNLYERVVRPETRNLRSFGSGLLGSVRISWRVWREFPDIGAVRGLGRVSLVLFAVLGLFMTVFDVALLPAVLAFTVLH